MEAIKVIKKRNGIIEMYPHIYFAVKEDGQKFMAQQYVKCLEFLSGKKIARA